jgi:hypothetical protein
MALGDSIVPTLSERSAEFGISERRGPAPPSAGAACLCGRRADSDPPQSQVVKVAWESNLRKMRIDFRLFKQCRQVLIALQLDGHVDAQLVERMMYLVVLSETSTIAEFDMQREARMMERAPRMLGETWREAWMNWARSLDLTAFPQVRTA